MQAAQNPAQWLKDLPTREEQVESLAKTPEYDMLIIGGGATGAGVAVDAGMIVLGFIFFFIKHLNNFRLN